MKHSSITSVIGFILTLLFIFTLNCARFRIEELEPSLISSFPITTSSQENPEQKVQIHLSDNVPYNFPLKPVTGETELYLIDPEKRVVRVMDRNSGQLKRIIGEKLEPLPEDATQITIKNSIPGWVTISGSGESYIQFLTPPATEAPEATEEQNLEKGIPGFFDTKDKTVSTSQIYRFNSSNQVVQIFGPDGTKESFFDLIYRMDGGAGNYLYVTHLENGKKVLTIYNSGSQLKHLTEFDPGDAQEKRKYLIEIEDYAPHPEGNFVIASVVFRERKSYTPAYRKIYRLDPGDNYNATEIYRTNDLDDYFCWSNLDGGFFMMKSEDNGSRLLFKIFSPDGEYLNNRLIRFPGLHSSWRETYMDINGRIFSSRIFRGNIEFYEWK